MTNGKSDRGLSPTPLTIYMLCANAAGRCQFEGCNKYLFEDDISLDKFNKTNVAHIVASSPRGPRGDTERSHKLSQSLDNLMLMCWDHHKMIDDNPDKYTETILLGMKQKHERVIADQCSLIYKEPSEVVMFTSPIKGKVPVNIQFNQVAEAIIPKKRVASMHGVYISVEVAADYKSKEFWIEAENQLTTKYRYMIMSALSTNPILHFSIFPIAPMPLIIKLGYLFGDKVRADIFQKTRSPDTWKWQADVIKNSFNIIKNVVRPGNKVALILSLTADIAVERITSIFNADTIYIVKANNLGVNSIESESDLSAFWHKYQEVCDDIKNSLTDIEEIALFPAMPISAAFEVGRRYMPGVYPKIKIYDDNDGFFETIMIGS